MSKTGWIVTATVVALVAATGTGPVLGGERDHARQDTVMKRPGVERMVKESDIEPAGLKKVEWIRTLQKTEGHAQNALTGPENGGRA